MSLWSPYNKQTFTAHWTLPPSSPPYKEWMTDKMVQSTQSTLEQTRSGEKSNIQSEPSDHPARLETRDEEHKHARTWQYIEDDCIFPGPRYVRSWVGSLYVST